ncbi:MAG: alpha-E domain-containing protein, partial [Phreatobacter sp.]|nr:alpha-E domain-containing protein [Phreatobacter sp.]
RLVELLTAWEALPKERSIGDPQAIAGIALHGPSAGGLLSLSRSALNAASVIRDRFSPDAWKTINDMVHLADRGNKPEVGAFDRIEGGLRLAAVFSGLTQENMNQLIGWRFMKIGKRIERALAVCRFARTFADAKAGTAGFDLLLGLADSQITYRRRYVMIAARAPVLDLVILDPNNPRSVAFQVERLADHLAHLPDHVADGRLNVPEKLIARARVDLQTADAHTLDARHILAIEQRLSAVSDEISERYFTHRDGARPLGAAANELF